MKTCRKCGDRKPFSEFPTRKDSEDGYRNECKGCKAVHDAEVHARRMSIPGFKEKETLRLQALRAAQSPEKKAADNARCLALAKEKAKKKREAFFSMHGCTAQELKWKNDGEAFVAKSLARNGDSYNYDAVVYRGVWTNVSIWCNTHKHFFQQSPKSHSIGSGCIECGKIATGNALRKSQEDFLKEALEYCGDKYTFEKAEYVATHVPVTVTCPTHGDFPIRPGNLFSGKGCPGCADYGYNPRKSGTLYILASTDTVKVGITNKPIQFRLKQINNSSGKNFEAHSQYHFDDGLMPQKLEQRILVDLRKSCEQPIEKYDGSTECFVGVDVDWLVRKVKYHIDNYETQ